MDLPENWMRYTAMPDAPSKHGFGEKQRINEVNVAMSATETITSNPCVLGSRPFSTGGIGEEDWCNDCSSLYLPARGCKTFQCFGEQFGT